MGPREPQLRVQRSHTYKNVFLRSDLDAALLRSAVQLQVKQLPHILRLHAFRLIFVNQAF